MSTDKKSVTDSTENKNTDATTPLPEKWRTLDVEKHPVSTCLHENTVIDEKTLPNTVLKEYTTFDVPEDTRPSVLNHQVSTTVGETIFNNTNLTKLYSYQRSGVVYEESEVTTAWKIGDTTDALVKYKRKRDDNEEWETRWWLPPLGETQDDLRWMTIHTLSRNDNITITYCSDETFESILQVTPPEDAPGIEQILRSQLE